MFSLQLTSFMCCAASLRRRFSMFSGTLSARLGDLARASPVISGN